VTSAAQQPVSQASYVSESRFADVNTPSIVSSVEAQQIRGGDGKMTLRLDPPELGALQVAVFIKDGLASVAFQAENPEAAKLLTNTLGQLRNSLTAAGITVDRMSVQQTAPSEKSSSSANNNSNSQSDSRNANPFQQQDDAARREQQRRELLERMWRRVSGDDLSYVA
jgi:flagellar hook-length control protein FliK